MSAARQAGRTDAAALERVRVDKWLWAARFFKTRSLAAQALEKGRVRTVAPGGGQVLKSSHGVRLGERLRIQIADSEWEVEVRGLSEVRGPAKVAQTLYEETSESRRARELEGERRRLYREPAAQIEGRPTKRDRRTIEKLSGSQ